MRECDSVSIRNSSDVIVEDDEDKERDGVVSGFWTPCLQCCAVGALLTGIILAVILALSLKTSTKVTPSTNLSVASSLLNTTVTNVSTASTSSITSATSTSTVSTTSVTTVTTTMTTTTSFDSCRYLQWNQTGTVYAGDGSSGSAANQLDYAGFIYIDANDSLYVCDHHNYRIQKFLKGSNSGITVLTIPQSTDHPESITFDKNGFMYVTGHNYHRVIRTSPDFLNVVTVAGRPGVSGSKADLLDDPLGLAVDDQLNLYVAERGNSRVMKWAPNATNGTVMIDGHATGTKFDGLLLSSYSSNQVYVSSEKDDAVYLWTFGSSTPSVVLTAVNDTNNSLIGQPKGIKYDTYGNLYVADTDNGRVVRYCINSTVGQVVVGGPLTKPTFSSAIDIAFDSDLNLYVSDSKLDKVFKFNRL